MGIRTKTRNSLYLVMAIFGLASCNDSKLPENSEPNKIKVAVFNGNGASAICILETIEALKIDTGIVSQEISAPDIENGLLKHFNVLIFPGGSASNELNNLGHSAAEKVKMFIKDGNGGVGICAGGYLFSTTKDYPSLQLVSATEWDREHYDKGRALVEFKLTASGKSVFPELDSTSCFLQYYDGPVLMPADSGKSGMPKYLEMATYLSDISIKKSYPTNITPGKTFLLGENVEKGKVMIIAGHPEATPGMRWMVPRMVRWVVNKPLISYSGKWIKPDLYDSAIFFNSNLQKKEKELYWHLFESNDSLKLNAMKELHEMHSRQAVRWNIGLLRDTNPNVRKMAAYYLKLTEYSAALPDLKAAFETEKEEACKNELEKSIDFLSNYK